MTIDAIDSVLQLDLADFLMPIFRPNLKQDEKKGFIMSFEIS